MQHEIKEEKSEDCKIYTSEELLPDLHCHAFVSKSATIQLADYVKKENWGKNYALLFKYLDFRWRFQLIDKQVKIFKYNNNNLLVFNCGLLDKINNEVYIILFPNDFMEATQQWRVSNGMHIYIYI